MSIDDEINNILDDLPKYLPDEMSGLNHHDLPETQSAIKELVERERRASKTRCLNCKKHKPEYCGWCLDD